MGTSAKVILDSISPSGHRLTTMEVVMHRFVLAEFNTHRVFSRNSASSRAIPVEKQLQRVLENPAFPIAWASEQPGMQGGNELTNGEEYSFLDDARWLFDDSHEAITNLISTYIREHPDKSTRLHKSLINRLLETFMWHIVIVSSTDYSNFFKLRCSPLAQPEIRVAAEAMRDALTASLPTHVSWDEFHTPYIEEDEEILNNSEKLRISAARCARVSVLNHDGIRNPVKDIDLFNKLISADPKHESPLEHVASPSNGLDLVKGNFNGWHQLRHNLQWINSV